MNEDFNCYIDIPGTDTRPSDIDIVDLIEENKCTFSDFTEIYGYLQFIGGKNEAKAHILNLSGKMVTCDIADMETAHKLAPSLYYDLLRLNGKAKYVIKDGNPILRGFEIHSFFTIEKPSISKTVDVLSEFLKEKYDKVEDPVAYFTHCRSLQRTADSLQSRANNPGRSL